MQYPKRRIKVSKVVFDIIRDVMKNAEGLELKYWHDAVAAVAAQRVVRVVQNNYRRRKK